MYRTIKDEATQHTALRTGKLDIPEVIRWSAADERKKNAPALKLARTLGRVGTYLACEWTPNCLTTFVCAAR